MTDNKSDSSNNQGSNNEEPKPTTEEIILDETNGKPLPWKPDETKSKG